MAASSKRADTTEVSRSGANLHMYQKSGIVIVVALTLCLLSVAGQRRTKQWRPDIPKMWVDQEMSELEVPLSNRTSSPKQIPAEYYYRIPVRPIYKTYPVYGPGREPAGYLESLRQLDPVIAFDPTKLKAREDWLKAGELVFEAPITTGKLGATTSSSDLYLRDPQWYERTKAPLTRDGILPFYRYVITEKGKVEIGILSCAMCHTRVMPDGNVIKGAQGNFPFDRALALDYRSNPDKLDDARALERSLFTVPGGDIRPENQFSKLSIEELARGHEAIPPGVLARHRSSVWYPVQVPDLIGVKDRRYLDRTGLQQHRSIVDLMRYAALNQGGDDLAQFDDFSPMALFFDGKRPDPNTQTRYGDEQLYALALYVYSLQPPANPNRFDALAAKGQKIFAREGCSGCHTPPLYTNNKLTLAEGFKIPMKDRQRYNILPISVGTDPNLTMKTRRGTGYYKVPSLRGVWYRGPFEHNGSVATLEDWFDPRRLGKDYEPTGFKGYGVTRRAINGHEFGLSLSEKDRRALIAFLRTL